ncbi:hypothetical protein K493DRAFT_320432 [Basidiobolus meristosporus CBS 931.73]|uniref:Uncharacterized protein n=1 Tax=Basidiobolus meristosporus CBS 931.73 TaxID=1314790 RepID=A0A1Y1X9X1_9FUNG|nr:hypothetical protein K493DRAFT_320432 [Basidiobolus meristosporus CBS 931.73]|eukprot:ORX82538.1 hypothetical protein K493DRAFT_320432 [Basidiobolus meristosporus CBS 931.73]
METTVDTVSSSHRVFGIPSILETILHMAAYNRPRANQITFDASQWQKFRRAHLANYALVCKDWCEAAKHILYSRLDLAYELRFLIDKENIFFRCNPGVNAKYVKEVEITALQLDLLFYDEKIANEEWFEYVHYQHNLSVCYFLLRCETLQCVTVHCTQELFEKVIRYPLGELFPNLRTMRVIVDELQYFEPPYVNYFPRNQRPQTQVHVRDLSIFSNLSKSEPSAERMFEILRCEDLMSLRTLLLKPIHHHSMNLLLQSDLTLPKLEVLTIEVSNNFADEEEYLRYYQPQVLMPITLNAFDSLLDFSFGLDPFSSLPIPRIHLRHILSMLSPDLRILSISQPGLRQDVKTLGLIAERFSRLVELKLHDGSISIGEGWQAGIMSEEPVEDQAVSLQPFFRQLLGRPNRIEVLKLYNIIPDASNFRIHGDASSSTEPSDGPRKYCPRLRHLVVTHIETNLIPFILEISQLPNLKHLVLDGIWPAVMDWNNLFVEMSYETFPSLRVILLFNNGLPFGMTAFWRRVAPKLTEFYVDKKMVTVHRPVCDHLTRYHF